MAVSATPKKESRKEPHVVIVGGGFAGLYAAKALRKAPVRVTLLDRRNHHLFQPLLYQVATAALSAGEIAVPIRSIVSRYRNVQVFLAEVTGVNLPDKKVVLADGELSYDYLILATGAQTAYFGNDDWAELAPGLKSVEDALEIRRRILCAYEAAERLPNGSPEFAEYLTFVIVGGGPTGVEMAGAIAEIARQTLKNDFRTINPVDTRVILIQSGPRVLAEYHEKLSESARRQLESLGVEVRTGPRVTDIENHEVVVGDEVIKARTIIWTAGITASPVAKSLNVPLDKGGRVLVQPDLTVPGFPEAYVVGDLTNFPHQTGEPLPGLAPIAVKEGESAARNILRTVAGRARRKFYYRDKGSMATIGRGSAVAQFGRFSLSGFPAWLAWLFIHIYFLIGFYNRIVIIFRWGWSYFTSNRGARLITGALCQSPLVKTPDVVPNDPQHPSLSMPALETDIVEAVETGAVAANGAAPK